MKVYTVDEISCEVVEVEVADFGKPGSENREMAVLRACLIHATLTCSMTDLVTPVMNGDPLLAEPDFGYEIQIRDYGHTMELSGLGAGQEMFAYFWGEEAKQMADERRYLYICKERDE